MYKSKQDHPVAKVMILGDGAVGKTALLMRFCDNVFTAAYTTTVGLDYKKKVVEIDGRKMIIEIWDTTGQENFNSVAAIYLKRCTGFILAYSINDKTSYERVAYWMNLVEQTSAENTPKIIVATKNDLKDQRKVSYEQGQELADRYNTQFFETSSLTDENVNQAFYALATQIRDIFFPDSAEDSSKKENYSNSASLSLKVDNIPPKPDPGCCG